MARLNHTKPKTKTVDTTYIMLDMSKDSDRLIGYLKEDIIFDSAKTAPADAPKACHVLDYQLGCDYWLREDTHKENRIVVVRRSMRDIDKLKSAQGGHIVGRSAMTIDASLTARTPKDRKEARAQLDEIPTDRPRYTHAPGKKHRRDAH